MKRCPYCAEEIQDAAIRCRYCRSALPLSGALRADGLAADIEVIQTGRRYVVGVLDEAYALWDVLSPESPLERFSGDQTGLEAALDRFHELDRLARGPLPWLGPVRWTFLLSVIVWAVARGVETTWLYAIGTGRFQFGGIPGPLLVVQAVADIAFVGWVASLATVGALWLTDTLRSTAGGR